MFTRRLMTTVLFAVLHTITSVLNEDSQPPSQDQIDINVGKRIRMECELSNSTTNNMNGLWLRIEDAEVFFYSMTRINPDRRFQIEQRPTLHIVNSTFTYEVVTYTLIIDDIRLSDDGTYSCQVDNRIIKQFILNIVERPYFVTHEYTTLLRTQIGKNVTIDCEAQGKPRPLVSWIKRPTDDNNQKLMINCSTTPTICQLHIVNVTRWHSGTFECVATNAIGTIGRFYELDVQFPPDVSSSLTKSFHYTGDSVTLACLIDANPEPDVRWLHRFSSETSREIDLTRQFFERHTEHNNNHHHHRRVNEVSWSIEQEQINGTRWKTILFIQHLPKRFFNSIFICRAINRFGRQQREIFILENPHYHASKKHRHPTTTTPTSTSLITSPDRLPLSIRRKSTSTHQADISLLSQTNNRSSRRTSFYSLIMIFFTLMSSLYVQ